VLAIALAGCGAGDPPAYDRTRTREFQALLAALDQGEHELAERKLQRLQPLVPDPRFVNDNLLQTREDAVLQQANAALAEPDVAAALAAVQQGRAQHPASRRLRNAEARLQALAKVAAYHRAGPLADPAAAPERVAELQATLDQRLLAGQGRTAALLRDRGDELAPGIREGLAAALRGRPVPVREALLAAPAWLELALFAAWSAGGHAPEEELVSVLPEEAATACGAYLRHLLALREGRLRAGLAGLRALQAAHPNISLRPLRQLRRALAAQAEAPAGLGVPDALELIYRLH